ncbi:hypothetical protein M404DRAFT_1003904, partial [Pisolithus tinctorius Marx 270]
MPPGIRHGSVRDKQSKIGHKMLWGDKLRVPPSQRNLTISRTDTVRITADACQCFLKTWIQYLG